MMFPMAFGGAPLGAAQWEKKPEPISQAGLHLFFHRAMACDWSIRVPDEEHGGHAFAYAEQAVEAAWAEVDRLEAELSRFVETSDIARVNTRAGSGDWAPIGASAWECLSWATEVAAQSGGAFDVALARILEQRRLDDGTFEAGADAPEDPWPGPPLRFLELSEEPMSARLTDDSAQLDLGAIGKGYALDGAAQVLREWSIGDALMHAGQSSVLAMGDEPQVLADAEDSESARRGWRVELRAPWEAGASLGAVSLRDAALGGSGRAVQGYHIVDPRTGRGARAWRASWVLCPDFAALADALSTAFMVLGRGEIQDFCLQRPQLSVLAWREGEALALGPDFAHVDFKDAPAEAPDAEPGASA